MSASEDKLAPTPASAATNDEPLLCTDTNRFVLFPIKYPTLWALYKQAEAAFWTAEEIDLSEDKFDELTPDEQHYLKHVLAFFASADAVVMENLAANFAVEIQAAEARAFYANQIFMESIHNEVYSLLIDSYVKNTEEKASLFRAIETMPCIRAKYEWAQKYMNPDLATFSERLVAFACMEGIFFSGAFCAIFYLKKRGLMPGLTFSNELISRDEGLHCDFACALLKELAPQSRPSYSQVCNIITDAVKVEEAFVCEALPVGLIGLNATSMCQYIRFCADRLCEALGYTGRRVYNGKYENPFEWMEMISLHGKTNFFEKRVGEYKLASLAKGNMAEAFTMDEDF